MYWHRMHWYGYTGTATGTGIRVRVHRYVYTVRVYRYGCTLVRVYWYWCAGTGTTLVRAHRCWYAVAVRASCSDRAIMQPCSRAVVVVHSCSRAIMQSYSRAVVHSCSRIVVQSCSSSNGSSGDIGGSSIEGPEQFPSVPNCPYLIVPVLVPSVPELAIVLVFCYCIRFHTESMGMPLFYRSGIGYCIIFLLLY